jgi:hypothetical protein
MNKKTAVKTTVLDLVKVKSKVVKRNLDVEEREPIEVTRSRATLSKAKDMADLSKQISWTKVRLDARKTTGNFVKLNLVNATIFSAETNWIMLASNNSTFGEASVAYKALKAGDNFLIRFFIDVISNNSLFQVSTFGGTAPVTMTLNSGPHEIPVVAVAQNAGDHSAQLLLKEANKAYYLSAIEIEPL